MKVLSLVLLSLIALGTATQAGQPVATLPIETLLTERLGLPPADVSRLAGGDVMVWKVPGTVSNEIAAAGAVRARGDLRRLTAWFRDIEAFMKASGTTNVGAIGNPASASDVARLDFRDADLKDLAACRPGKCEIRMPAAFMERFQKEVDWTAHDATQKAGALGRTLVEEYVSAYQRGGDAALGAHHNEKLPRDMADEFRDMLRRSSRIWDLSYPFAQYLEAFPANPPEGVESRFYWTRGSLLQKPTLTLHHVVLQEFPDGRVLVADKQFYASRQIDAALLVALGVPSADKSSFDLIVSVKARADALGGVAARVLRGRLEKEVEGEVKTYLAWIRASMAL